MVKIAAMPFFFKALVALFTIVDPIGPVPVMLVAVFGLLGQQIFTALD